jgi:hypothetical protein
MSIVSVGDILGAPTPQSLDDFSVSSPSSFMSSRHASPCSYVSTETSSSVASPPASEDATKVKSESEQKPVKKRKSWGQQLPTPTTNLPPRYESIVCSRHTEHITNIATGSEPRQPKKKSNVGSSACFVIGPPLKNRERLRNNSWRRSNRKEIC